MDSSASLLTKQITSKDWKQFRLDKILPGPRSALLLVLQQHNEAAHALLGQHRLFQQRLADVHSERDIQQKGVFS